jgi:hypothetical protein
MIMEPKFHHPQLKSQQQGRRVLWGLLAGLALLAGTAVWLLLFHDGPPPEDSALVVTRTERESSDNPLAHFCRVLASSSLESYDKLSRAEKMGEAGTEEAGEAFLDTQTEVFAALEALLTTPTSTWHWPAGILDPSFAARNKFHRLNFCLRLRHKILDRQGRHAESVEDGLSMVKLAHGLYRAQGGIKAHLNSQDFHTTGLKSLEDSLRQTNAPVERLFEIQQFLQQHPGAGREDVILALRLEYTFLKSVILHDSGEQVNPEKFGQPSQERTPALFFKPNRTLHLLHGLTNRTVEALSLAWPDALKAARAGARLHQPIEVRSLSHQWLNGNRFGESLASVTVRYHAGWLESTLVTRAWHDETITMIALRRFELHHGRLPDRLEELVPDFLDEVPVDPFTNVPLLWSADKSALYSTGSNLTDDGGTFDAPERFQAKDAGSHYWWGR